MRTLVKVAGVLSALAGLVVSASPAAAADSPVGTWVREGGDPAKPQETMVIESWGVGGTRLGTSTNGAASVGTIMSNLDGADSPVVVNGKASTATVALTLLDEHTLTTVTKINLRTIGASKWTFSPDFTRLTIEDDFAEAVPGTPVGRSVERWTRK
jgi:hypothetical protein